MHSLCFLLSTLAAVNEPTPPTPRWPECAVRSGTDGAPAIVVDGKPLPPIMFSGNNQFGRDDVLVEELHLAAAAGTPFFVFEWRVDEAHAMEVLERFCEAHPEGYFYLRTWVGPDHAWLAENPDERITKSDGSITHYVSPASLSGRTHVSERFREKLQFVLQSPYADRFIGSAVQYLHTAEWFYPETNDYMDYSPANRRAFRQWLKEKYATDEALQSAWGQADITLETAEIPTPEAREEAAFGAFRDPVKHRAAADLTQFQSEIVADTIAHYCRVVKEETQGRSLAGAFYGYTHEINNNGRRALAHSGHLALGKLLDCPDIDIIQAPYAYFERALGQPGHFHLPVDSVILHGKLPIMEEDTFTHLATPPAPGVPAPGWRERTKTLQETISITARNYGNFLTHRAGFWFFDLLSDGRWNDRGFWKSTALAQRLAQHAQEVPPFTPEVAFVVDETTVGAMRDTTWPALPHAIAHWRAEMDRLGTPVGYYLQSDVRQLPESVKVVVFANAYRANAGVRETASDVLARGGTVIWTYAAGLIDGTDVSVDHVAELTGFPVAARFDDVPMHLRDEIGGELYEIDGDSWAPRFVVTAEEGEVLARYDTTGELLAIARREGNGMVVYTATPRLPVPALRHLCDQAGVHRYHDFPGMTGVVGDYLIVHGSSDLPEGYTETFRWPAPLTKVTRIHPTKHALPLDADSQTWHERIAPRITYVYQCER